MRSLPSIAEHFPKASESGLTEEEVIESRSRFGDNRLTPLPRESVWKKFFAKFDEPIIKILLAASLLKILVDLFSARPAAGLAGLFAVTTVIIGFRLTALRDRLPAVVFLLALGLVGLSAALGQPSYEGLAVMVAVTLATGVSFLSEYRSDREFETLNARKDSIRVKVIRESRLRSTTLEDIVVGDLVVLETGDEIPADGRVIAAHELVVDQSLMTGESEPVVKQPARAEDQRTATDGPDSPSCVFRGTQVVGGAARMLVTNVGDDTMLGQIARRLSGDDSPKADDPTQRIQRKLTISRETTPLQEKLEALARLISRVGYAAAISIFVALVLRGIFVVDPPEIFLPKSRADLLTVVRHLLDDFVYMVIIIVVAVPEGLPMSVTISLALAMRKMTRANSLVRQLVACETIGSATVICTDKTGTLTQNKMRVESLGLTGEVRDGAQVRLGMKDRFAGRPLLSSAWDWLALNAALNSTASLEEKDGRIVVIGSSTEGALLHWLADCGLDAADLRERMPTVLRVAFSSESKQMATIARVGGRLILFVKGAPEVILSRSVAYTSPSGERRDWSAKDREQVTFDIASAASRAMRTLAFGHAELPAHFLNDQVETEKPLAALEWPLVFDGFVGIRDPLREDVKEAVAECRQAGIDVKMITGDNRETAQAIAKEVGLLDQPEALVITSEELDQLTDDELKTKLPRVRVVARARPLDKYRLVKLLQEQGHVVAMTGDGTNDAPSLKKADVGLAMGVSGTEVAKEASKIILLDDAFSTIVRAVHWGRALYENIQRFIQFQLTINVSALAIAFLGPFLGLRPPFTVLQLLWINVIMDTFAAIALCSEPPRPGLMRQPPKRRDENILTPAMLGTIFLTAAFFVITMLVLLLGMEHMGWFSGMETQRNEFDLTTRQVSIFFTAYVFFQVWNQINCRSLSPDEPGWARLFSNPQFLAIASLTVMGQVLIVQFGGTIFAVEPLALNDWLAIALATTSVLVFAEVTRRIRRRLASPGIKDQHASADASFHGSHSLTGRLS